MVRPISALRYSSTRYPGFGLRSVSDYQTPAAPAAVAATGGGGGGAATAELIDPNREGRDEGDGPPSIGRGATMEEAFQTNKFLSNPLAQVAAAALPFPLNLFPAAVQAVTGPLAPADRQTYNAARMSPDEERGLTPAEATRVTDPYFDMNKTDFTAAGGGGGLTERGAAGGLGPVEVTSEPIANATPGASQTYQGPAQTAPAAVTGGEIGGDRDSTGGGEMGGGGSAQSGPHGKFHQGGPVTDGDPSTYQNNMQAIVQEGEHVMTRAAVDLLGPDFFEVINEVAKQAGGMPPGALEALIMEAVGTATNQTSPGATPATPNGGAPVMPAQPPAPVPPQGGPPQGGPPIPPVSPQGPRTSLAGQQFRR